MNAEEERLREQEEERLREQEAARAATMEAEREYLREWVEDVTRCLICCKELENPMTMVCSKECQRTLVLELTNEVDQRTLLLELAKEVNRGA